MSVPSFRFWVQLLWSHLLSVNMDLLFIFSRLRVESESESSSHHPSHTFLDDARFWLFSWNRFWTLFGIVQVSSIIPSTESSFNPAVVRPCLIKDLSTGIEVLISTRCFLSLQSAVSSCSPLFHPSRQRIRISSTGALFLVGLNV